MTDEIQQIVESFLAELRETGRGLLGGLRGPGRTPVTALEIAKRVQAIYEVTQQNLSATFPPETPVACKAGCTYCCHLMFFTDALTVFRVADWLRSHRSEPEIEDLKWRLQEYIEGGFGLNEVPRPACPLLVDGLCMAYEARPLVCRAQNALRVSECVEKYEGGRDMVVAHDMPIRVWVALSEGLTAGYAEAGLAGSGSLEFTTALGIVLDDPTVIDRWLAGEPVFAAAQWSEAPGQGAAAVH